MATIAQKINSIESMIHTIYLEGVMMNKFHDDLEKAIITAFIKLYEKDEHLITLEAVDLSGGKDGHASERGIVARFAIYLQAEMYKNDNLKDYHLDVEYNRNGNIPKNLLGAKQKGNGVYPDLIVHKRGPAGPNLLIAEFKTHWNKGKKAVINDINKLKAFLEPTYNYENALFVVLNQNEPKRFWITEESDGDKIYRSIKQVRSPSPLKLT